MAHQMAASRPLSPGFLVAAGSLLALLACSSAGRGPARSGDAPEPSGAGPSQRDGAESQAPDGGGSAPAMPPPGPEASDAAASPLVTCGVTVDCDCPAGLLVRGRTESESCCELDCAAGEEIVERDAGGTTRYHCVRCTHRP
jgi:hypothetical protein